MFRALHRCRHAVHRCRWQKRENLVKTPRLSTAPPTSPPPQPPPGLTGLLLQFPEVLQVLEREPRVGESVPLANNFGIEKGAVLQVHVREGPPVLVVPLPVVLQPDPLSLRHPPRERRGLLAEVLDRLPGILRLRGVHTDQPDPFPALQFERVPVDDALDDIGLGLRPGELRRLWCAWRGRPAALAVLVIRA